MREHFKTITPGHFPPALHPDQLELGYRMLLAEVSNRLLIYCNLVPKMHFAFKCGHIFCTKCFADSFLALGQPMITTFGRCSVPFPLKEITELKNFGEPLKNIFREILVPCPWNSGSPVCWVDMECHFECDQSRIPCPFLDCDVIATYNTIQKHYESCPFKKFYCWNCKSRRRDGPQCCVAEL